MASIPGARDHATTQSVVWSILIMLIANALLTGLFFFVG